MISFGNPECAKNSSFLMRFFLIDVFLATFYSRAMRPGYALYTYRFAPFSAHAAATTPAEIARLIAGSTSALVAAIVLAFTPAAHAQESVEEAALPAWTEPTLPSSESAPSTEAAPLPSVPESLPSTPEEALPSSEEAFPTTPDPWSSS